MGFFEDLPDMGLVVNPTKMFCGSQTNGNTRGTFCLVQQIKLRLPNLTEGIFQIFPFAPFRNLNFILFPIALYPEEHMACRPMLHK